VPISVILLIAIGIVALLFAGLSFVAMIQRREVMLRASGLGAEQRPRATALKPARDEIATGIRGWLLGLMPAGSDEEESQEKLTQAGFDTPVAPATFFLFRITAFVTLAVVAFSFAPRDSFGLYVTAIVIAVFFGYMLPIGLLDRLIRQRQEKIRRSVPDALDLLVVCVEAGVSLDAAVLRVAREIRMAHPDLAHELAVVNRKTNAGIPRDIALRGLWQRTGVEELRTLVSSMIQSEKWGTSIATVLRIAAETLRRKRRQYAEKKAKMAPLKMTFPLLLFILPALFIVIMGPAVVQIINEFSKV
jgi:tight adherence protein C